MTAESRIMDAKRIIDAWKLDEKNEPATLEAGYQHSMRVISYRRVEELINDVLAALEDDVEDEDDEFCPECGSPTVSEIPPDFGEKALVGTEIRCLACHWSRFDKGGSYQ